MTATNLKLRGAPIRFRGAFLGQLNTSLGLAQSPSTCTLTLAEDALATPSAIFNPPTMGEFETITVGSLTFAGVITSYQTDVANIGGRQITVNMSDPREIMKAIPIIIAPGYRTVATTILATNCSLIDAFGAYDDFDTTGLNLSGWNQAGMRYEDIARAFEGGSVVYSDTAFKVATQLGKAFGQDYYFNLAEVTAKVDPNYRVSNNLISVADFIQEMASRHSFDWYVESTNNVARNRVDVVIRTIDRSVENTDIDLDNFLAANSGFVMSAQRGFELRTDLSCAVLLGAPTESLEAVSCLGLANNPVDLSTEDGSDKYYMTEEEMRYVLTGKEWWKTWVDMNGGLVRYTLGGAAVLGALWDYSGGSDLDSQTGASPSRGAIEEADEEITGRMYDKLLGHAQATYGKRFMFSSIAGVDYIDAAYTVDAIAGNNDPNEYFRNGEGKTRCYVEFARNLGILTDPPTQPSFVLGLGANAPQPLQLELRNQFDLLTAVTDIDKSDWIIKLLAGGDPRQGGSLFVAATIEEGNVVKLDAPVIFGTADPEEGTDTVATAGGAFNIREAAGGTASVSERRAAKRAMAKGEAGGAIHQKVYQPARVHIPTKSQFNRYGPVFASDLNSSSEGKLIIDQDDGFSPWEFGSSELMLDAMQFRVDNSSSQVKTVESATITVENYPALSIGDSLGLNSNINNITVSLGNPVSTTYELRSFLRQFGELSKEELTMLSLFARRGGARVFPQDSVGFINRNRPRIAKQFGGKGSSSTSATGGGMGNFE